MTAPIVPDPVKEIRVLLLADTAVSGLAGTRVFGGELPESENVSMPLACAVVSPAGGPGRPGTVKYRRNRVDTICYGATVNEAWSLHLAVREVLETMGRDGALFSAETSSEGSLGIDPVKHWPTCYASYIVMSATEA